MLTITVQETNQGVCLTCIIHSSSDQENIDLNIAEMDSDLGVVGMTGPTMDIAPTARRYAAATRMRKQRNRLGWAPLFCSRRPLPSQFACFV
jgi:hypothetical protein